MDLENDPDFWKWLIEQQKEQNNQKDAFQPLVLELPLPPPQWRPSEESESEKSPDYDTFDEYIIFEL